jgi:hypothetical protein
MVNKLYKEGWTDTGMGISRGGTLNRSDLFAINVNLDLKHIDPQFLPGEKTVSGTPNMRKSEIFRVAELLWGLTPQDWLDKENNWLMSERLQIGSTETSGKDKLDDVISAEILVRTVAVARVVQDDMLAHEAILALNVTLSGVCAKGRTRMIMEGGKSIYSRLKENGIMIGTGGGKYLPYPEKSLPELLCMLHREFIRPEVYLS